LHIEPCALNQFLDLHRIYLNNWTNGQNKCLVKCTRSITSETIDSTSARIDNTAQGFYFFDINTSKRFGKDIATTMTLVCRCRFTVEVALHN